MNPELLEAIQAVSVASRPALIGISGFSGSGKSAMAVSLTRELPETCIVEADLLWNPEMDRLSEDWSSIDRLRLRSEVLVPLRMGEDATFRPYDWEQEKLGAPVTLPKCRRAIVEGIGIFHPDLSDLFDVKVWVDAPFEDAMESGMRRDREEYGLANEAQWRDVWIPNERAYFERFRPDLMADIRIPWYGAPLE